MVRSSLTNKFFGLLSVFFPFAPVLPGTFPFCLRTPDFAFPGNSLSEGAGLDLRSSSQSCDRATQPAGRLQKRRAWRSAIMGPPTFGGFRLRSVVLRQFILSG